MRGKLLILVFALTLGACNQSNGYRSYERRNCDGPASCEIPAHPERH